MDPNIPIDRQNVADENIDDNEDECECPEGYHDIFANCRGY